MELKQAAAFELLQNWRFVRNSHQVNGYWQNPRRKAAESVQDYLPHGVETDPARSRVWVDGADQGRVEAVDKVQQYVTAHGWCVLREANV